MSYSQNNFAVHEVEGGGDSIKTKVSHSTFTSTRELGRKEGSGDPWLPGTPPPPPGSATGLAQKLMSLHKGCQKNVKLHKRFSSGQEVLDR